MYESMGRRWPFAHRSNAWLVPGVAVFKTAWLFGKKNAKRKDSVTVPYFSYVSCEKNSFTNDQKKL